jgi:hypothetical protein
MAHGGNSLGASCDAGGLADPFFWRDRLSAARNAPIMLAHFGGFKHISIDPDGGVNPASSRACASIEEIKIEQTFEASIARYIRDNPSQPVYADLSMLVEVLTPSNYKATLTKLKEMRVICPSLDRHLVFGTDWLFLSLMSGSNHYDCDVRRLLTAAFDPSGAERIMRQNFLDYARLGGGPLSPAFTRLSKIYGGDAALTDRLTAACQA